METRNLEKSLEEIFKNKYIIPLYQRNFAWSDEEIGQLLQDVYESYIKAREGNYFIGSLVVLRRRDGDFEIIDGQQRLTVITLIAKILSLDCIREPKLYYDSRPEVEAFFSSFYRTGSTTDVTFDHKVSHLVHAVDIIKETVINPDERQPKTILGIEDLADFKSFFSKNVILVRVEIPEDTDVANYFEIMNNRGEQLQKHEILKAKLIDKIKDDQDQHDLNLQKIFAQIWDACSQMDIPIQKLFSKPDRERYFGQDYNEFKKDLSFQDKKESDGNNQDNNKEKDKKITIDSIIGHEYSFQNGKPVTFDDIEDESDDKSIIDFPNFLMHVFRLLYNKEYQAKTQNKGLIEGSDIPLNEKDLISVFEEISDYINSMDFVFELLYSRIVFDRFIVKASSDENAEDSYKWSLEMPYKYTYEVKNSTSLKYKNTFGTNERIVKCLSFLQVTFRNRKYKNWLQDVLSWFRDERSLNIEASEYQSKLDHWVMDYYAGNFKDIFVEKAYSEGTYTPHFLFNYIDYLYWVESKINPGKNKFEFEFKYRNSVEHHLPQSFKNDTNKEWIDNLGNLCLVSKSSNSKMNNEDPKGKASHSGKYYRNNLPPKQKVMYDFTNEKNSWGVEEITEHYIDVVNLLSRSTELFQIESEI